MGMGSKAIYGTCPWKIPGARHSVEATSQPQADASEHHEAFAVRLPPNRPAPHAVVFKLVGA
jgi:hypothetical protein